MNILWENILWNPPKITIDTNLCVCVCVDRKIYLSKWKWTDQCKIYNKIDECLNPYQKIPVFPHILYGFVSLHEPHWEEKETFSELI